MRLPNALLLILANYVLLTASQNSNNTDTYAPTANVACPSEPLLRTFSAQNQSLSSFEAAYLQSRAPVINKAWQTWLSNISALGYDSSSFNDSNYPKVGIALAGGGHRAALYEAGVLSALDGRNTTSVTAGTGGLLQVASHLSALSGGSWITGSLYFNDFPAIQDMVFGNGGNVSGWNLDLNLIIPNGVNIFDDKNQGFFGSIMSSIMSKANQGIQTSLADVWSRMISYHYLPGTNQNNFFTNDSSHGAGLLWSNIPQIPSVANFQLPFPILMADSRPVGSNLTGVLSPEPIVYEITPAEFGSWDPNLSAMMNTKFVGTNLNDGNVANGSACVTGFDEAGFMMGTSAMILNSVLDTATNTLDGFQNTDLAALTYLLGWLLSEVRVDVQDVAVWPNPFQSLKPDTFEDSNSTFLELIDGGSNDEVVPLGSLFVKARTLDVIVAVDDDSDESNHWPNGTSLLFTQNRIKTILQSTHQSFPPIPSSADQFVSTGVNQRPTFFGCDPTQSPPEWPLVIYLPNSPPNNGEDPVTNTDTFQLAYTAKQASLLIDQSYTNTIGGFVPNATGSDPSWGKCLQCAAIDRARLKVSPPVSRSSFCTTCFKQYCFDPQNPPNGAEIVNRKFNFVDPDPSGLDKAESFAAKHKVPIIIASSIAGVLLVGLFGWCCFFRQKHRYSRVHSRGF